MKNAKLNALAFVLTFTVVAVNAEPIKRDMLGCVTEEPLDEAIGYAG